MSSQRVFVCSLPIANGRFQCRMLAFLERRKCTILIFKPSATAAALGGAHPQMGCNGPFDARLEASKSSRRVALLKTPKNVISQKWHAPFLYSKTLENRKMLQKGKEKADISIRKK